MLHKLLLRQLKRCFNLGASGPIPDNIKAFVSAVNEAYYQADADRQLLERSMDLSSQELLQANSEMRAIFQMMPDLFFRLNAEGRILDYKGGIQRNLYLPDRNLIGKRIQDIPEMEARDKFEKAITELTDKQSLVSIDYCIHFKGEPRFYEARLIPIVRKEIFVIIRDMTERRIAKERLLERTQQLEDTLARLKESQEKVVRSEKLALVGRLASSVGHELRNPMAAIKNAVYYIRERLLGSALIEEDPTIGEFLDLTDKEIQRSTLIINDLLDYSKVKKLSLQQADLNRLLSHALKTVSIPSGVKIVEDYAADLPPTSIDSQRMLQVFINLLTNAIQAMPDNGTLRLRTAVDNGDVAIAVQDTGCGIPPENIKSIFDPLFTTKEQGTGLGLAICQEIVDSHGGQISVQSSTGQGSTFTVRLKTQAPNANGR